MESKEQAAVGSLPAASRRELRVFLSSTFRDMKLERDVLAKRVFPELRRLCEARGVVFSEVDLRWGVTDEQRAEGKVLPLCFAEIERCRPYFLGLLGERYGWIPEQVPDELVAVAPWLRELSGQSVTELEICHGVLHQPSRSEDAFFYFRDPRWSETGPEGREDATGDEVLLLGKPEADRRAEERQHKLASLKQRIRQAPASLAGRPGRRARRSRKSLCRPSSTRTMG